MKIGIIGHKRIPSNEGGIEKGVEQHAIRMISRGHKVTAYNRGGHNVFGKEYDDRKFKNYKGIKIVTVPTVKGSACVPIYSFLATFHAIFSRYDVISYRASGSCAMIPLAKLFGIRCVASLHGIDSQRDKWGGFASRYLRFGEKMAATKADVCLVLSKNMKRYIKDTYGVESVLFANGVDAPTLLPPVKIKKRFGLEKDNYLLSLGRVVPEKGLHYLIEAFLQCKTNKQLIIAGGSEANSDYYKHLVEQAENDDRIKFVGFVTGDMIAELYSNAYAFILPSNLEGMANALLEAMSYGNCCLVSDIPENTEVVKDKAIIFEKGNIMQLKEKMQEILDNNEMVSLFKKQAAPYILDKYNWDKVVTQILEVYAGNIIEYEDIEASS
ncbi:MAG: glycosyltransferase family 4 protein [Erysipelotrichaceae bacterium]|nr:glycosyltransferase family 4 protein [Erysipelotrichaceae bacterium]